MKSREDGAGMHFDTWWTEPQAMTLDQYRSREALVDRPPSSMLLPELEPFELVDEAEW